MITHRCEKFRFIAMTSSTVRPYGRPPLHVCLCDRLHGYTTSAIVLTQSMLFVFRWKTVWKMFSFCIFRRFQSSLTYHNSCGPHWWLRSYSSQASEGCKLKAESFFSLCFAIFGISLEALIRLYDAWRTYD